MSGRAAIAAALLLVLAWCSPAGAADDQLEQGRKAIQSLTGCYLVDYSFVETESLRPGYARDPRVYDVNRDKSVKEWITAERLSERRIWLQRILFATDLRGAVRAGSELRHQSEDWEYGAPFLYEFVAPQRWEVKDLRATPGLWTRRITNLDDGPRYQCAGRWKTETAYPEWSCASYAPIPGRETRDLARADYQALDRDTRIVAYGGSWLERQENVKTIHAEGRTPLVRETGKTWYVRLPDAECATAQAFARPRKAFWALLRETWDGVLGGGDSPFAEATPPGQPPRFMKMYEVEEEYGGRDLADPAVRSAARARILRLIEDYRLRALPK